MISKMFSIRNKELANDASSAIAMTEQEKQRLSELLSDIDLEVPLETESEVMYNLHVHFKSYS